MNPIAVDLPRPHARHEHVPVVIGAVGRGINADHPRGAGVIFPVEKQQIDSGGVAGEDTEIDAAGNDGGANGRTPASAFDQAA